MILTDSARANIFEDCMRETANELNVPEDNERILEAIVVLKELHRASGAYMFYHDTLGGDSIQAGREWVKMSRAWRRYREMALDEGTERRDADTTAHASSVRSDCIYGCCGRCQTSLEMKCPYGYHPNPVLDLRMGVEDDRRAGDRVCGPDGVNPQPEEPS